MPNIYIPENTAKLLMSNIGIVKIIESSPLIVIASMDCFAALAMTKGMKPPEALDSLGMTNHT
jgi:hypothetical protein